MQNQSCCCRDTTGRLRLRTVLFAFLIVLILILSIILALVLSRDRTDTSATMASAMTTTTTTTTSATIDTATRTITTTTRITTTATTTATATTPTTTMSTTTTATVVGECNHNITSGIAFQKARPISTANDCLDMALELGQPFRPSHDFSSDPWDVPPRCYIMNGAISFGPTNNPSSTFLCRKRSTPRCTVRAKDLCIGRASEVAGAFSEYWTPFTPVVNSSVFLRYAEQFLRRTCKTPTCHTKEDKKWCCDRKLRRAETTPNKDTISLLQRSSIAHGYSMTKRAIKSQVFKIRKNAAEVDYTVDTTPKCDSSHRVFYMHADNTATARTNASKNNSTGTAWGFNFALGPFGFGFKRNSTEMHTAGELNFIKRAYSENKTIIESKDDCISAQVASTAGARPIFTEEFLSLLNSAQQQMSEEGQARTFRAFVERFGLHVIVRAQLGGTTRTFRATDNTTLAINLTQSLQLCSNANDKYDINSTLHKFGNNKVTNSTWWPDIKWWLNHKKQQHQCEKKQLESAGQTFTTENEHHVQHLGTCTMCGDPAPQLRRRAQQRTPENLALLNVNITSILQFIRPEWLTASTWFGTFTKYNVPAIKRFLTRWQGLETGHTCFTYDYEHATAEHATRHACFHGPHVSSSCHLHMCTSAHLLTKTKHVDARCPDSRCTKDFCCNPVPFRNTCTPPAPGAEPLECVDDELCVDRTSHSVCATSDTDCRCVDGKDWWTTYRRRLKADCPAKGSHFTGDTIEQGHHQHHQESWEDCGQLCSHTVACVAWQWNKDLRACTLIRKINGQPSEHARKDANIVSGLKDCPGETPVCAKLSDKSGHQADTKDTLPMVRLNRKMQRVPVLNYPWRMMSDTAQCKYPATCSAVKIETYYAFSVKTDCPYGCAGIQCNCACGTKVVISNLRFTSAINAGGKVWDNYPPADVYCYLYFQGHGEKRWHYIGSTSTISSSMPHWRHEHWQVDGTKKPLEKLKIHCWDSDTGKDDNIGGILIDWKEINMNKNQHITKKLEAAWDTSKPPSMSFDSHCDRP